jgi:LPS-assembly lipoprotein
MYRHVLFTSLIGILLYLAGCGFQLRGTSALPADRGPVFVQAGFGTRVGPLLTQALQTAGSAMTGNPAGARTLVRILEEQDEERVSAVNARGKVIGIELVYRVAFDAVAADGTVLAERQSLVGTREYVNPSVEVLGKAEEANLIRSDLARDLADRILRRLQAQLQIPDPSR